MPSEGLVSVNYRFQAWSSRSFSATTVLVVAARHFPLIQSMALNQRLLARCPENKKCMPTWRYTVALSAGFQCSAFALSGMRTVASNGT